MKISRDEALKAVDDIFNYCEEIDNSLPENEQSGYKMLPDIHKIRKYIIENTRPHGEWVERDDGDEIYDRYRKCTNCGEAIISTHMSYCGNCGAKMGEGEEQ